MDKNEITESLFDAINIIARQAVNEIAYDSTKICEVVDVSEADNHWYMVNDGSIKFKAYSEEKYRLEDKVRVSIPNGDFTQTKYIIGKSVKEDEIIQPISYVSEIDSVLSLEEDLSINNKEFGIKANGGDMGFVPIWEVDISRLTDSIARSSICDTFYIQADFRCMLNSYNIKSGSYGLKVEFYIPVVGTGGYIIKTAYMDSKDMFGNPYAFTIFSTQEKKFHLSTIAPQISAIKVYFYQSDDFTYKKNGVISRLEPGEFNNIFVRNIITGFGSEIANIEDNSLQIYTKQTMYYDNTSAVNNQKDISIAWYNKDENNKYLGFSDGVYDPEYDEMEYLDKATAISRLMSRVNQNVPNDYPGLSLAADIEDINKSVGNVNKIIKFDLVSALRDYSLKLKDILSNKDIENHFDDMITTAQSNYEKIQENLTKLQNEYYSWLKKAVQYLNGEEVEDLPVFPDVNAPEDMTNEITTSETLESYQQIINSSLTLTQEELKYFALIEPTYGVDSLITTVANNYPAYLGICQKYRAKIEKIYNQIQEVLDNFLKLISNNEDEKAEGTNIDQLLAYFKDDYKFIDIKEFLKDEDDLTQYDNKYCLYWYHYNPDKINEDKYAFMDLGWERIGGRNQGLPAEDENNEGYYVKDDESIIDSLSVGLDLFKPEEKYALVLFYNHEQINSNILTFTNNTEEASDEDIALQGEISIINDQYSLDHYPYYGVDNLLIASERSYERQIKIKYEGTYYNQDEVLPGALIKWYIPAYSSMILPVELNNSWVKVEDEAGYYCYQKTIEIDDNNKVKDKDLTFKYKIDVNYSPNFINNTIKCKITQNDIKLEAEKSFTFGNEGSSGTQYELRITPIDEQNFKDNELKLDISLFNGYEEVPIYTENTSGLETELGLYAWGAELSIIPTQNDFKVEKIALSNERETLTGCRITKTDTENYCGILQVNVNIGEEDRIITLTQYYPIGYNKIKDLAFEGASSIVYDNLGANPSFISRPYRLYQNGEQVNVNKWYMVYYTQNSDDYVRNDLSKEEFEFYKKYMPTLANNILAPSNLYIDNIDCYATVEAVDKNNELLWAQNIFIMQNRYPSTFINKWDGDFEINEENGTIMGTMFGAGRKNEKNQFEGVLMGDVATGTQSSLGHKVGNGIGLYGFNQGAQSFAFLNDGTGFIGKSGAGRILFDGNNSFIASSNWFSSGGRILNNGETGGFSTEGMLINLQDGHIDAYNFKLTSKSILIDSSSNDGKGSISINTKNQQYPLQINNSFHVDWDGNIDATGTINAIQGKIGRWQIISEYGKQEIRLSDKFIKEYHPSPDTINFDDKNIRYCNLNTTFDGLLDYFGYGKLTGYENRVYEGAINVGLFPNRDNVFVIGVPHDEWVFKVEKDKGTYFTNDDGSLAPNVAWNSDTNKWQLQTNFGNARCRIMDSGEIICTGFKVKTSTLTGSTGASLVINDAGMSITNGNINGNLTGDVTGNLNGNVTGDVNGNIIGKVIMQNGSIFIDGESPTDGIYFKVASEDAMLDATNVNTLVSQTGNFSFVDGEVKVFNVYKEAQELINIDIDNDNIRFGGWRLGSTGFYSRDKEEGENESSISIGLRSSAEATGSLFYLKPERFKIKLGGTEENWPTITEYIQSFIPNKVEGAQYLFNNESGNLLNVGSASHPVYFSNGIPVPCDALAVDLPDSHRENAKLMVKSYTVDEEGKKTEWGLYQSEVGLIDLLAKIKDLEARIKGLEGNNGEEGETI